MMNVSVNLNEFKDAVEAIWLKGKYKSSTVSKIDAISNMGVAFIKTNNTLTLANASESIAASVTIIASAEDAKEDMMVIFDIEKLNKYLKVFKEDHLILRITDSQMILKDESQRAKMQLSVEHGSIGAILKIQTLKIPTEGMPVFGTTPLEAKYRHTFCWNLHATEHFECELPLVAHEGESATVEFSAPIDKFCMSGVMYLFLRDDKPILLIGPNRKLIVAPYIRVR